MSKDGKKKKKVNNWKYIKRSAPYFLIEKTSLVVLIIFSLLSAVVQSFFPALSGMVLNYVTKGKLDYALYFSCIVLAIGLVSSFFVGIINVTFIKVQNAVTFNIRKDILNSYFEIDNKTLNKKSSGIFLSRITQDPRSIFNAFASIRSNISNLLGNFFVVFYIFYLNWILGIIVVLGTTLVYIIEKASMDKYMASKKIINKKWEKTTGTINEGIKGVHDIKLLNIVSYFKDKIFIGLDEQNNDNLKAYKIDSNYAILRDAVVEIFTAAVVILGIFFVKYNLMSVATLTVIFMYRSRLFTSIMYIAWSQRHIKEFGLAAERIFDVIDTNKFPKEKYGTKRINELKGNIEFKNVHFSYQKDEVLKGVSFTINEKDTVAIVGRSGSGKTTIINLLNRSFVKSSGKILLDGNEINELDRLSLRRNISVITQDPYIFNVTIKENLKMVCPDASQKQLENVCKICEIHDYIMSLPKKYNTLIGEGGVNLSGGEKQRLAIARALLLRTNIILFDEATSALDNETQASIQEAINNISSEYTMIIIAHRLSTIKNCNKIIVVDKGKVIGVGNHKELYESNQVYKTLYEKELQK